MDHEQQIQELIDYARTSEPDADVIIAKAKEIAAASEESGSEPQPIRAQPRRCLPRNSNCATSQRPIF